MTEPHTLNIQDLQNAPYFIRIHHVGIAVPDLDTAIPAYEALFGQSVQRVEEVQDQQVRTAFFSVGESHFELLEATAETSPIARYLNKNRPGIHHLCVEVEDVESVLARYRELGVQLIDEHPRRGAHDMMVAFIHPRSTGGVLLELAQTA
ncbi:MAG: methylmalonyl-CoA epimerase [Bradymonadia bacterium]